jgi:hypothetical protein
MTAGDPFGVLGLDATATVDDLRRERRRLALACHPDRGGDPARMTAINAAYDAAVLIATGAAHDAVHDADTTKNTAATGTTGATATRDADDGSSDRRPNRTHPRRGYEHDPASFLIHCLPVEAFEALSVAISWIGELVDDDPPHRLIALLNEPSPCWCRLDLVADAGATTVDLTIGGFEGDAGPPSAEQLRDTLVAAINRL